MELERFDKGRYPGDPALEENVDGKYIKYDSVKDYIEWKKLPDSGGTWLFMDYNSYTEEYLEVELVNICALCNPDELIIAPTQQGYDWTREKSIHPKPGKYLKVNFPS